MEPPDFNHGEGVSAKGMFGDDALWREIWKEIKNGPYGSFLFKILVKKGKILADFIFQMKRKRKWYLSTE